MSATPAHRFSPPPIRQCALLFGLLAFSYSYFFNPMGWNQAARVATMRAMVTDGVMHVTQYPDMAGGDVVTIPAPRGQGGKPAALRIKDQVYSNKPPGTVFLGAPSWAVGYWLASRLASQEAALMAAQYVSTVFVSGLPTAAMGTLLFWFLVRSTGRRVSSLVVAIGFGLGTLVFPFGTMHFSHCASAAFLFAAFYLVWSARDRPAGDRAALRRLFAGGALCGYSVVLEYPAAVPAAMITLYALACARATDDVSARRRACLFLVLGIEAGLVPLLLYNLGVAGRVLFIPNAYFEKTATGLALNLAPLTSQVNPPSASVLWESLFGAQRGLFFGSAWLLAGVGGLVAMALAREHRREAVLFSCIVAAHVLLNSGFGDSVLYWGGSYSPGPRHLITILPFLAAAAAWWRFGLVLAVPVILWSVLLMLAATSVEPRFDPRFANPFFEFALPLFADSNLGLSMGLSYLSTSHFGGHAWNLGRVMGLDGSLQLLPLLLVWAVVGFLLFRDARAIRG